MAQTAPDIRFLSVKLVGDHAPPAVIIYCKYLRGMCKFIFNPPLGFFFVQINKEGLGGKLIINTTFSMSDSFQVLYSFTNI